MDKLVVQITRIVENQNLKCFLSEISTSRQMNNYTFL